MCAAPVNNEENNNNMENNQPSISRRKNQTYKNKEAAKKLSKNMLDNLYQDTDDNESKNLGDFSPIQHPVQKQLQDRSPQPAPAQPKWDQDDPPISSQNAYASLDSSAGADYYQQYNNNYNNINQPHAPLSNQSSELLKKLDNILYLLEEQREEQTNLITEELILYIFLGVFVIYVLDSFVRAGKYVR
jgi:hypothetical protein